MTYAGLGGLNSWPAFRREKMVSLKPQIVISSLFDQMRMGMMM
jgi:hypothetical protein